MDNAGDDFKTATWDMYHVAGPYPCSMAFRNRGTDGWCVEEIRLNFVKLHTTLLPRWFDDCDTHDAYAGIPCSDEITFLLPCFRAGTLKLNAEIGNFTEDNSTFLP